MKKSIFAFVLALCLVTFVTTPVFAQRASSSAPLKDRPQNKEVRQNDRQDRAGKEVTRRLTALQELLTRINAAERLSATVKTSITTEIQKEIDALTAFQTKLEAGTLTTLETDIQTIRNSYNTYGLLMQKVHIFVAAEKLLKTTDLMSTQASGLQAKITAAQQAGNDVTELQKLLADMEGNITDAKTQAENAITTITPLTAAGYPGNKTQLQSAREMLRTGRQSLLAARGDANQIIRTLLKMNISGTSITPKVTCIPRPICLDATPACKMAEPANGWCPTTVTSSSAE